LVIVLQR